MMLIGVALYRSGVLGGARSTRFYRRMALLGLSTGLPLSALGLAMVAASVFVAAVWALQLWWSLAWLDRFRHGPAEWLWRCATYRTRQPLRKHPSP